MDWGECLEKNTLDEYRPREWPVFWLTACVFLFYAFALEIYLGPLYRLLKFPLLFFYLPIALGSGWWLMRKTQKDLDPGQIRIYRYGMIGLVMLAVSFTVFVRLV